MDKRMDMYAMAIKVYYYNTSIDFSLCQSFKDIYRKDDYD